MKKEVIKLGIRMMANKVPRARKKTKKNKKEMKRLQREETTMIKMK